MGDPDEPGLIPRALEYIFRTIPRLQETPRAIPLANGELIRLDKQMYHMMKTEKFAILNTTSIDHMSHIKTYKYVFFLFNSN